MSKCVLLLLILAVHSESVFLRGKRANEGQFPWLIQFQTVIPCGGVLISPDWILTAAQCVQDKRNSIILYAAGVNGTGSRQTMTVKATYIFPKYQPYSTIRDHENNVALLKLMRPFDVCDKKISLWDIAPLKLDDIYKSCLIFGWQSYVSPSYRVSAKPIHYNEVILNSWRMCTYRSRQNATFANVFCTMVESDNGMEACAGNPGSPLTCEDEYNRTVLVGIASWTNFSLDCGGFPTYLGINLFRSWMCDLILNDKEMEQQEFDRNLKTDVCKPKQHLGEFIERTQLRNISDIVANVHKSMIPLGNKRLNFQQNSQVVTDDRLTPNRYPKSQFRNSKVSQYSENMPSYTINEYDYGKLTVPEKYYNTIVIDTIKDPQSSLKQYQEIGQTALIPSKVNRITRPSKDRNTPEYPKKHLPNEDRTRNKLPMLYEDSVNDDVEFLLPFNFETINLSIANWLITSNYVIIACFIWIYFVCNTYLF